MPTSNPVQVLRTSQSGLPDANNAQNLLIDVFGKLLNKLALQACRRYFLKDQERDEVVAETFQQLLNPKITRFATSRGKPAHYFKGLVQNAARKVMTQRGTRSRKGAEDGATAVEQSRPVVLTTPSAAENAEQKDTVRFILEQATPQVRRALELCYWEEWSIQSIAEHLGLSRFTLARQLEAFLKQMNELLGDV